MLPPGYAVGPDSGGYGLSRYLCLPKQSVFASCSSAKVPDPDLVNCQKQMLCSNGVCACDAEGCSFYEPPSGQVATRVKLDAALDDAGDSLVGTLKIGNGGQVSVTVRLKRVPNQ